MSKKPKLKGVLTCDKCGSYNLHIYNSREFNETRWRTRECLMCGNRFSSYEIRKEDYEKIKQFNSCKGFLTDIRDSINAIIEKMEGVQNE